MWCIPLLHDIRWLTGLLDPPEAVCEDTLHGTTVDRLLVLDGIRPGTAMRLAGRGELQTGAETEVYRQTQARSNQ